MESALLILLDSSPKRWFIDSKLCRIPACISRRGLGALERLFHICLLALRPGFKPGQDVLVGKQVTNHMYINVLFSYK